MMRRCTNGGASICGGVYHCPANPCTHSRHNRQTLEITWGPIGPHFVYSVNSSPKNNYDFYDDDLPIIVPIIITL